MINRLNFNKNVWKKSVTMNNLLLMIMLNTKDNSLVLKIKKFNWKNT